MIQYDSARDADAYISSDGGAFSVLRPASNGSERVSISAPCVVAFDKTTSELRRPNVKGIMMAKKKPVESMDAGSLGVDVSGSSATINSQSPPDEKSPGQMFEGADSVSEVVQKLRNEAKVL